LILLFDLLSSLYYNIAYTANTVKVQLKCYGSLLSQINDMNINLELVKSGLAEVSKDNLPDDFNMEPYREAEAAANNAKKGMWILGDKYMSPRAWRESQNKK
jgi:endonuclease YncB( thermonuclease family)